MFLLVVFVLVSVVVFCVATILIIRSEVVVDALSKVVGVDDFWYCDPVTFYYSDAFWTVSDLPTVCYVITSTRP
jgi:hypothetical protein